MHPIGPALFTLCGSLALAGYLLARRHKEPLHWMLIGYLAGLMIWNAGVLARFTVVTPEGLAVALRIVFTGVLISSSFWLLTAINYLPRRPTSASRTLIVLVISSLFALALFTNDGHRLFLRRVDFAAVEEGPPSYVGPLFWLFLSWAYGCVGCGMVLYLRFAQTMLRAESRRRGILLAIASAVPVISSTVYVFQLLPLRYDLTPTGLMIAMIVLSVAVFRYQLLENLPLARDAALAHLEDGVVMASASGRVTQWNPSAARILGDAGLRRGADLGAVLARLVLRGDRGADLGTLTDGQRPVALRTADGRVIEVMTAVLDAGRGEPAGRFAILRDRSESDRVEQLARQAQRLEIVGALAGEVAREINDPLTFVRSNLAELERMGARVDAAERDGPDAELAVEIADLREIALDTLEGVERIRRIVDGMRALSSAERTGAAAVDLNAAARDALRLARLGPDGDGPPVELALGALPPVRGNADRLVQVVLNLLVNARQALAATANAAIRIETRDDGADVELSVSDNGPGIPEALRERVFDPFFTTRAPDEGTGLGLAIAFDIAREHGGALEARSQPGEGARFVLRLPALRGDVGGAPGAPGTGRQVESHLE